MKIEKTVIRCIHNLSNIPIKQITVDKSLQNDLNFDSIMIISLGMHLEEELKVDIIQLTESIDFISDITVNDILIAVKSLVR